MQLPSGGAGPPSTSPRREERGWHPDQSRLLLTSRRAPLLDQPGPTQPSHSTVQQTNSCVGRRAPLLDQPDSRHGAALPLRHPAPPRGYPPLPTPSRSLLQAAVTSACFLSGLAGVWLERIVKRTAQVRGAAEAARDGPRRLEMARDGLRAAEMGRDQPSGSPSGRRRSRLAADYRPPPAATHRSRSGCGMCSSARCRCSSAPARSRGSTAAPSARAPPCRASTPHTPPGPPRKQRAGTAQAASCRATLG